MHRKKRGTIAQLVEQRTENPCVPGSIPGGTTLRNQSRNALVFLFYTAQFSSPKNIDKKKFHRPESAELVDLWGFEPQLTEPKSAVLPLHHRSNKNPVP